MDFENWLLQIGKSQRSAKSYAGAVSGVMSEWAKKAGLFSGSLIEIDEISALRKVGDALTKLDIFIQRNTKGNGMYSAALKQYEAYLRDTTSADLQDDLEQIIHNKDIGETEKSTYINARVGQGKYRKDLINYWGQCALTGFKDTRFLVASHIKPWRQSEPRERLDQYNGLLLLPNLDKAFDLGFITFSEVGQIIVSSSLENTEIIGVEKAMRLDLTDQHRSYMAFHRETVFERLA